MKGKYLEMVREGELSLYPRVDFKIRQGREVARQYLLVIPILVLALLGLARLGKAFDNSSFTVLAAQAPPGSYVISCLMEAPALVPCPTGNEIPVGTALILKAHVTDASGNLAKNGSLIFQDCLLQGIPAPSIQCDSGPGVWSNIQRVHISGPEDIRIGYGRPSTPQTIGFRFRYCCAQASGIANGISNSMDVTWF